MRRFPMRFGRSDVDLADAAVLAAIVLLGPLWALVVVVPVSLYRPLIRTVFVLSGDIVRIIAVGFCFTFFSEPLIAGGALERAFISGLLLAGILYYTIDALINAVLLRLKYRRPLSTTLDDDLLPMLPANLLGLVTVLLSAFTIWYVGPMAALVLFCGIGAALLLTRLLYDRQSRAEAAETQVEELRSQLYSSGFKLAWAVVQQIGKKDGYTDRHAMASAIYAKDLAWWLGLSEERIELVRRAALLQNIGMLACSEEVLHTPEHKLNPLGRRNLEHHPVDGEQLLATLPGLGEEVPRWVLCHHERDDGSGYPNRIPAAWIPLEAKIIGLTAHYAHLILDKPPERATDHHTVRKQLTQMAGIQFEYTLVTALMNLLDSQDLNYATASDHRFGPHGRYLHQSGLTSVGTPPA